MISRVGIDAFMTTLGMLSVTGGIAYVLTQGAPLPVILPMQVDFHGIGTGNDIWNQRDYLYNGDTGFGLWLGGEKAIVV